MLECLSPRRQLRPSLLFVSKNGELPRVECLKGTSMEQHALKNVNNCLNTNIQSYLQTSSGQSSNLYENQGTLIRYLCENVVHFFNTCMN
jgi:hypothetical protein